MCSYLTIVFNSAQDGGWELKGAQKSTVSLFCGLRADLWAKPII